MHEASTAAAATGSVSPATVAPGDTVTVTFASTGATYVCDDQGADFNDPLYTYADKPLVFGLFPSSVARDPDPLTIPSDGRGRSGQVTLASTLAPGTYNAVWGCGSDSADGYDAGAPSRPPTPCLATRLAARTA